MGCRDTAVRARPAAVAAEWVPSRGLVDTPIDPCGGELLDAPLPSRNQLFPVVFRLSTSDGRRSLPDALRYDGAMLRYQKRHQFMAVGLAALAGFVDALGFLKMNGLFVSFMSGNSTRMAVDILNLNPISAAAATLIVAFLTGVVAGALVGQSAHGWRKQAVLGLVTLLLLIASVLTTTGPQAGLVTLVMACAMGAANNVFQRDGEVTIGVTYMTGTLVKIGQKLADSFTGGKPAALYPYLLLWMGLVAGGVAGAAVFPWLGLRALWIASAFAACLFGSALVLGPAPLEPRT